MMIKSENSLMRNHHYIKIMEKDISFVFPFKLYKKKVYTSNGWNMKSYTINKIGIFRIGMAKGKNSSFIKSTIKYFNLNEFPKSGKRFYFGKKGIMFIKNIPLFSNGVYVMKKRGNGIIYIYFFSLKNNFYWIDFKTGNTLKNYKKIFDNILLSILSNDKKIKRQLPLSEFSKKLDSACKESYFILCQSLKVIILLPTLFIIIIFLIISKVMSFGGKLPDDNYFKEEFPLLREEKTDYQLKFKYNNKISTGAFVLTDKNIYLFSFKKPFFIFPRDGNDYVITEGKSFFGGNYIQIQSSNTGYMKKGKIFGNLYQIRGDYKLRIFSKQIDNIKNHLPFKKVL